MQANGTLLVNLLKGPKQFEIPIYQRPYSWTEEQCQQLFDDIERVALQDRLPSHFVGSIVYIGQGVYQATTLSTLLVIDGQQRMTTCCLLIEALARALEADGGAGEWSPKKLRNQYLLNPDEDGQKQFKLRLSDADQPTYEAVITRRALPQTPSRRMTHALEYFLDRVGRSRLSPAQLHHGLCKLMIVDVALDREKDNPQLIFESLNSTGLDLSQSDLIRNYVLMGLEPAVQRDLYARHWQPMEAALDVDRDPGNFDRFLRAWLALRRGEVTKREDGYRYFKRYREQELSTPIPDLVRDLHRCSNWFAAIALDKESDPHIARPLNGLKKMRVDSPTPFLMHAYELRDEGQLNTAGLARVLLMIEAWLFRRSACDIPSNVLSRLFATLPKHLHREDLPASLELWLATRERRQRFPSDGEFKSALQARNMYDFIHARYLLERLENDGHKEPIPISDKISIEHILPKNAPRSADWRAMLGDALEATHEALLHNLGNLTLTGYNSELSDRSFAEKQRMPGGFLESHFRLNAGLGSLQRWDAEAIRKRAELLAERAVGIWSSLQVPEKALSRGNASGRGRKRATNRTIEDVRMSDLAKARILEIAELGKRFGLSVVYFADVACLALPSLSKPYPLLIWPRRRGCMVQSFIDPQALDPLPPGAWVRQRPDGTSRTRLQIEEPKDLKVLEDLLLRTMELHWPEQLAGPEHR